MLISTLPTTNLFKIAFLFTLSIFFLKKVQYSVNCIYKYWAQYVRLLDWIHYHEIHILEIWNVVSKTIIDTAIKKILKIVILRKCIPPKLDLFPVSLLSQAEQDILKCSHFLEEAVNLGLLGKSWKIVVILRYHIHTITHWSSQLQGYKKSNISF